MRNARAGLSLCIQGTRAQFLPVLRYFRFIPVYTGNTFAFCKILNLMSVYPCVYREHQLNIGWKYFLAGLSLCIQGTRIDFTSSAGIGRFIPVYTGNTRIILAISARNSVYPCVYREHESIIKMRNARAGLSLCIQGTRAQFLPVLRYFRFIPVYTGNTFAFCKILNLMSVYPCVYREHQLNIGWKYFLAGLSLCIQGTRIDFTSSAGIGRFIPVYTGNTRIILAISARNSVYPCVYREH